MDRIKNYHIPIVRQATPFIQATIKPTTLIKLLKRKGFKILYIDKEGRMITFSHPDRIKIYGDSSYLYGWNNKLYRYCNKPFILHNGPIA